MRAIVKSKKWYGWFWPPERKKIKIMQFFLDNNMAEIQRKTEIEIRNQLIYGKSKLK